MKLDRDKFLAANKGHNIGVALDAIDGLLNILEEYAIADKRSASMGRGCFNYPETFIHASLIGSDIKQYVIFDGKGVKP